MTPLSITIAVPAHAEPAPTRASAEAASRLGYLFVEPPRTQTAAAAAAGHNITIPISPGAVTLILGTSGAGKSTLLRAAAERARDLGVAVVNPETIRLRDRPAVELVRLGRTTDDALAALSDAGLAEASLVVRRPSQMSDGQRARLRLAVALSTIKQHHNNGPGVPPAQNKTSGTGVPPVQNKTSGMGVPPVQNKTSGTGVSPVQSKISGKGVPPVLLLLDEFAATLDRATATGLAESLTRAARDVGAATIIATPRHDLEPFLRPTAIVRLGRPGRVRVETTPPTPPVPLSDRYDITPGSLADYRALARHHYRAGAPARPARVLVARDARTGETAGVIVVCFPTLNASWRALAWPGLFNTGDRRRNATLLNGSLRRIARVVVAPEHRGVGLAAHLVRAYLNKPETPCTEAVAAMGRFSDFFTRAGMTRYDLPLRPRDARLLDALDSAGVEPWRLATPRAAYERAAATLGEQTLARELERWSSTPRADPRDIFRDACRRLAVGMTAFAHTAGGFTAETQGSQRGERGERG